jgi:hypothetical protein
MTSWLRMLPGIHGLVSSGACGSAGGQIIPDVRSIRPGRGEEAGKTAMPSSVTWLWVRHPVSGASGGVCGGPIGDIGESLWV